LLLDRRQLTHLRLVLLFQVVVLSCYTCDEFFQPVQFFLQTGLCLLQLYIGFAEQRLSAAYFALHLEDCILLLIQSLLHLLELSLILGLLVRFLAHDILFLLPQLSDKLFLFRLQHLILLSQKVNLLFKECFLFVKLRIILHLPSRRLLVLLLLHLQLSINFIFSPLEVFLLLL
jgi:hypothetical protein